MIWRRKAYQTQEKYAWEQQAYRANAGWGEWSLVRESLITLYFFFFLSFIWGLNSIQQKPEEKKRKINDTSSQTTFLSTQPSRGEDEEEEEEGGSIGLLEVCWGEWSLVRSFLRYT